MQRRPPFPSIPNCSPVWIDGADQPVHYRHNETGEIIATPDYATWKGGWSMIMPVDAWHSIKF